MNEQKKDFLQNHFSDALQKLNADTKPKWGKMSAQQMVEHVAAFFKVSTNKLHFDLVTPVEHLPKYLEFLRSEISFKEDTKAPPHIIPEEGLSPYYPSLEIAVEKLNQEVNDFFIYFEEDAERKTSHPVFGELNFDDWVLLHHKHVMHHFGQFGLV